MSPKGDLQRGANSLYEFVYVYKKKNSSQNSDNMLWSLRGCPSPSKSHSYSTWTQRIPTAHDDAKPKTVSSHPSYARCVAPPQRSMPWRLLTIVSRPIRPKWQSLFGYTWRRVFNGANIDERKIGLWLSTLRHFKTTSSAQEKGSSSTMSQQELHRGGIMDKRRKLHRGRQRACPPPRIGRLLKKI